MTQDAAGNDVVLINTDGGWRYVGRLQVEFDDQGHIVTESITDTTSKVYTATDETAASLWGSLDAAYAEGSKGAIAQELVGSVADLVTAKDGITYGKTDVYLQGERAFVRTEETNLGDLTADANLWYARQVDDTVAVSIKNGGGIREPIGTVFAVAPRVSMSCARHRPTKRRASPRGKSPSWISSHPYASTTRSPSLP